VTTALLVTTAALVLFVPTTATAANDEVPFTVQLSGTVAFTSPTTVEFHVEVMRRVSTVRVER
jgi:hypothetical protein